VTTDQLFPIVAAELAKENIEVKLIPSEASIRDSRCSRVAENSPTTSSSPRP
jgi:hypothetical protein